MNSETDAVQAGMASKPYPDESARMNWRRRFWRFVFGYTEPLFTKEMVEDMTNKMVKRRFAENENELSGMRRFQIVDAMNGKIIRFTPDDSENGPLSLARSSRGQFAEQYYIVPEGESLVAAIARLIVVDKVTAK